MGVNRIGTFTLKPFSTKAFGPGHLVGAGILVFGTIAITKAFIAQAKAETERARRATRPSATDDQTVTRSTNERGQYEAR
jgi:hypothetical protein